MCFLFLPYLNQFVLMFCKATRNIRHACDAISYRNSSRRIMSIITAKTKTLEGSPLVYNLKKPPMLLLLVDDDCGRDKTSSAAQQHRSTGKHLKTAVNGVSHKMFPLLLLLLLAITSLLMYVTQ